MVTPLGFFWVRIPCPLHAIEFMNRVRDFANTSWKLTG